MTAGEDKPGGDAPSDAFRPLDPPRNLTGEVIARLTEEIVSGKLGPSARLPTEQEMIAAFGVSRTVVREAIAALRAEGLVETRQGAGAFVAKDPRRPFRIDAEGPLNVSDVVDLMELRMTVETEAAGLAATRRTAAQLEAIAKALGAFERAVRAGEDAIDADFDFHCAIGAATANRYFLSFLRYLGSFIIPRRSIHVDDAAADARSAYLDGVVAEHTAIFDAIEAGDAAGASEAMRVHLSRGRDRVRRLDQDTAVD